jgi:hypothetical protein
MLIQDQVTVFQRLLYIKYGKQVGTQSDFATLLRHNITKSRAKPSQAEPSRAKPSQAEPSRAKPSQKAKTCAKSKSTSVCLLAIPALTASLGSLTDTLTLTGGCAYANYMESG